MASTQSGKRLKKDFLTLSLENPNWSSYVCFACAINGLGYSDSEIYYWFNKLVEKDDYHPSQKSTLLKLLREQTLKI